MLSAEPWKKTTPSLLQSGVDDLLKFVMQFAIFMTCRGEFIALAIVVSKCSNKTTVTMHRSCLLLMTGTSELSKGSAKH